MRNEEFPIELDYVVIGSLVSADDTMYLRCLRERGVQHGDFLPRRVAAHILALVAQAGESGNVDNDVTPELIGAAIGRLVSNYEGGDWLERFMRGLFR